jgi:hypothetical protein
MLYILVVGPEYRIPKESNGGPDLKAIGKHFFISLEPKIRGQDINFCSQVIHNAKNGPIHGPFLINLAVGGV